MTINVQQMRELMSPRRVGSVMAIVVAFARSRGVQQAGSR